jgi:hypothetical protein
MWLIRMEVCIDPSRSSKSAVHVGQIAYALL